MVARLCRKEGRAARGIVFGEGQNLAEIDVIEHFLAQRRFLPQTCPVRSCTPLPSPKTVERKIKKYRAPAPPCLLAREA